mmetsp:Transcript_29816/g.59415  ORF Transcript_29816/g.59415 Transcript_29816/m.59415 type:complete len:270 (-) Transcript_29816:724-1533(-)
MNHSSKDSISIFTGLSRGTVGMGIYNGTVRNTIGLDSLISLLLVPLLHRIQKLLRLFRRRYATPAFGRSLPQRIFCKSIHAGVVNKGCRFGVFETELIEAFHVHEELSGFVGGSFFEAVGVSIDNGPKRECIRGEVLVSFIISSSHFIQQKFSSIGAILFSTSRHCIDYRIKRPRIRFQIHRTPLRLIKLVHPSQQLLRLFRRPFFRAPRPRRNHRIVRYLIRLDVRPSLVVEGVHSVQECLGPFGGVFACASRPGGDGVGKGDCVGYN